MGWTVFKYRLPYHQNLSVLNGKSFLELVLKGR